MTNEHITDERLAEVLTEAYGSPEWTMADVRAARAVEAASLALRHAAQPASASAAEQAATPEVEVPLWADVDNKARRGENLSPIERIIHNYESADPEQAETFRDDLAAALALRPAAQPVGEPFGWWFTEDPDVFCMPGSGFRRFPDKPQHTVECIALYTTPQPSPSTAREFVEWMKSQPEDREPTTIDGALAEFEAQQPARPN